MDIAERLARRDPFTNSTCDFCRVPWTPLERHIEGCLWWDADQLIQRRTVTADESVVTHQPSE